MIYVDTETCSFTGPVILIQHSEDGEDIKLHNMWLKPIDETLSLIKWICKEGITAFNLSFDWFQLQKAYTTLLELKKKVGNALPIDYIESYALCEPDARFGPCIKPTKAMDLFLHAKKTNYQSIMDRKAIRIKRIPTKAVPTLINVLNEKLKFPDIYFARKKDRTERWKAYDVIDNGVNRPDLKDVVLKFAPSIAMKELIKDIFGGETVKFKDIMVEKKYQPFEVEYAPYALAHGKPFAWNNTWPAVIRHHITHWEVNEDARYYATKDVEYLKKLDDHFGNPTPNDYDSILAAMVASCRWRGFSVDIEGLKELKAKAKAKVENSPHQFSRNVVCVDYLKETLSPAEQTVLKTANNKISTGKEILLQLIKKTKGEQTCDACWGMSCDQCEDGLIKSDELHPVAVRAQEIIDYRTAQKEENLFNKALLAERLHVDLNVIGTKSSRMSGRGGFSIHGVNHDPQIREKFTLYDPGYILCGGDFVSFEVSLLDAAFLDPKLHEDLLRTHPCPDCEGTAKCNGRCKECKSSRKVCNGKCKECEDGRTRTKIHALFGTYLFPGNSYEDIIASKKLKGYKNLYSRAKAGVFALAYGGEAFTLVNKCGVDPEVAEQAYAKWVATYRVWGQKRFEIVEKFCTAKQTEQGRFVWSDPADKIESMFGFVRWFTLENQSSKAIFDLAENLPKIFYSFKGKVLRREEKGEQRIAGAIRSALYSACCSIQSQNARAAANHLIQAAGAQKCKELQEELWRLQPAGVYPWSIQLLNIHDEIMAVMLPELADKAEEIKTDFVNRLREKVTLADMEWEKGLLSWAEK